MKRPPITPRNAAMDLLARREHSRLELERKLARRFDAQELALAIDRLTEEGLQSDARFAATFTRERVLRGRGPRRIRADLRERGVVGTLAEDALREVLRETGESWQSLAETALKKRFGEADLSGVEPQERARRLRFLYRQGFETDGFGPILD